jgi:5-methylcytosine-specific restriction endonuclease McrA
MLLPKPVKRAIVKRQADRKKGVSRRRCVLIVWKRAKGKCERCGKKVRPARECYGWEDDRGDVNEKVPRSLGGDPTNPDDCELTCKACHFGGPSGAHAPTKERMR